MIGLRAAIVVFAASATVAPFQCASEPDPTRVREETPAEALHKLAVDFEKAGDKEAQVKTLRFLVDRYPRSKFAEEAKVELKELGVDIEAEGSANASAKASAPASAPSPSAATSSSAPGSSASARR